MRTSIDWSANFFVTHGVSSVPRLISRKNAPQRDQLGQFGVAVSGDQLDGVRARHSRRWSGQVMIIFRARERARL